SRVPPKRKIYTPLSTSPNKNQRRCGGTAEYYQDNKIKQHRHHNETL
ncbi:unnamed protein product, partial [Allacma fusca]